jgi:hypothetical protein
MKLYKVVRFCKMCSKRFFAGNEKGYGQYYCPDCFKKYKRKD